MISILKLLQNRNVILITALSSGLLLPQAAIVIKPYLIWILAIVMLFSTSGIDFRVFKDIKASIKITSSSILLSYILFGIVLLGFTYILFDDPDLQNGFVVVAASPPGVAVIPFTAIYKGNIQYALIGILGTYIAAIFLTPLILNTFTNVPNLNTTRIFTTIGIVVVLPLILSRFLRIKKIYPTVEKIRGKIVNYGFATIIYTSIGLNRDLLLNHFSIVIYSIIIFIISMFILGLVYSKLISRKINKELNISQNFMLTIKSSGFSAATALTLFESKAAVPAAVLSIFVLLYLLFAEIWAPPKSPLHKTILGDTSLN